ncbi:hypothetical protein BO86DRAFT_402365 [Aspergillus japonicus CBS 114.51]|uniref:Uncharacterized protein n=1 Tax=Aspergillus japonicus CBS 114.51 TaxID=1448312 RepID=A0A8T8WTN5_ASPJA|nr:hypothetical protein BO86DRAFT_402365 [Aspergillus japonicus CBS 114.51]RAH78852.1 hypothetical protein BO86DRAFT_402365 [Aspergillus japonicus CBS 114.51]
MADLWIAQVPNIVGPAHDFPFDPNIRIYPNWGFFVYYAPFSSKSPAFSDEIIDQLKTFIHCEVNDTDEADRGLPQQIRESLELDVKAAGWDEEKVFVKAIDLLYNPRDGTPEFPYYQGWFKVGVHYIHDFYHQVCWDTDDYPSNMERICPIQDGPGRNRTYRGGR